MAEEGWTQPYYPGAEVGFGGNRDDQYLRKWTLSLGKAGGDQRVITTETKGMDFRMTFKVRHADSDTPGTAEIRIYNLSNTTANDVIKEYTKVILQAGYIHGHFGKIFEGTIKQFKKGKENAVDSYLDIFAADGEADFNWSFIHTTVPAGSTLTQDRDRLAKAIPAPGSDTTVGYLHDPTTSAPSGTIGGLAPKSIRGAVLWGMTVDEAREYGKTTGTQWSIQHGILQNVATTAYMPGEIVVINSGTGMIGVPEVTQDGIFVNFLLNPNLYIKQRVQLDNRELNQYFAPGQDPTKSGAAMPTYGRYDAMPTYYASTSQDGVYCLLVLDHDGDTCGLPWYSHLTCLNVDPTNPFQSALAGGASSGV